MDRGEYCLFPILLSFYAVEDTEKSEEGGRKEER
jgi:hypothetical protein